MYAAETICLGFFFILTYTPTTSQLATTYRVASLFEEKYRNQELAFKHTIEKINLRGDIIKNAMLIYGTQNVKEQDSFEASKKVCREIKEGVAAIFGPVSRVSASHVQSICNSLNIPHVQAHWDPRENFNNLFSINLYPNYLKLSSAYLDIVRYWRWRSFTILYEDNDGLIRLQELLKASQGTPDSSPMKITIRKIDASVDNYVKMWKEMKARLEYKVIIDCHHTTAERLLLEAQKVCMVSDYNHFHFTTLDLGLVELEQFSHAGANITAFRLVDPTKPNVMHVTDDWVLEELNKRESPLQGQREIPTDVALMYDAVHLFARALHELLKAKDVTTQALSCSKDKKWTDGISLLNYMKTIDFEGLTGRVHYDNGKRTEFSLDVVELSGTGLLKVGTWDPRNKVNITTSNWKLPGEKPLANKTLRVVTVEDEPYTILKTKDRDPNHPYEGYCVDLLDMLSKRLGFNYTIYKSPKNEYGNCDKIPKNCKGPGKKDCEYEYKNCNGLVGELVDGKADIAVAGMTITYDREQVVDFT
ncbi:hypothetical protein KUTeg_007249 [Tegillarca granosa]|uniref:Ionotropic glutamate receptor L-glutamate and glycine-binding domain-containing protein n=1 Tax=Tegillarca granosa TaxID=220873 RepID=A0ABQ9FCP1_TEGGR|nr:hypothetical protein KUTeg_007249 [Tegillarca granosa]